MHSIGPSPYFPAITQLAENVKGFSFAAYLYGMHEGHTLVGYRPKTSTGALARRRVSMRQGDIIKLTMSREPLPTPPSRPLSHMMRISFNDDENFGLRPHPREDFHSETKQIMNAAREKENRTRLMRTSCPRKGKKRIVQIVCEFPLEKI